MPQPIQICRTWNYATRKAAREVGQYIDFNLHSFHQFDMWRNPTILSGRKSGSPGFVMMF